MSIYVGATGPGELLVLDVAAPAGVDLSAAATLSLSVVVTRPRGSTFTLAGNDWTLSSVAAGSLVATYEPDGSEYTERGDHTYRPTLTVDGVPYRYARFIERVEES